MGWNQEIKAGYRYDVLWQDQEADCGPCCAAMCINLVVGGKPTSSAVRQGLTSGAYTPSTVDRSGFKPSLLTQVVQPSTTHSPGTYLQSLQSVLSSQYNIASSINGPAPTVAAAIAGATHQTPVIMHVTWTGGARHWVVIAKSMGSAHFILDPAYGLQINSSITHYEGVVQGGGGAGTVSKVNYGYWTGHWLAVTGTIRNAPSTSGFKLPGM